MVGNHSYGARLVKVYVVMKRLEAAGNAVPYACGCLSAQLIHLCDEIVDYAVRDASCAQGVHCGGAMQFRDIGYVRG